MCKVVIDLLKKIAGGPAIIDNFLSRESEDLARRGVSAINKIVESNMVSIGAFTKLLLGNERRIDDFEKAIEFLANSEGVDTKEPFYKCIYQNGYFKLERLNNYTVRYKVRRFLSEKGEHGLFVLEKLGSDKTLDKLQAFIGLVVNRYLYVVENGQDEEAAEDVDGGDTPPLSPISPLDSPDVLPVPVALKRPLSSRGDPAGKRPSVSREAGFEEKISKELSEQWRQNKSSEAGKRKSSVALMQEANYAHQELLNKGILFESDNCEHQKSGRGFSENFVKLFIRYIERSYPDLKDYVKIYYHQAPVGAHSAAYYDEERKSYEDYFGAYWDKVKKLAKKSETIDKIYIIINQGVYRLGGKVGENEGHGNITVVYNGKYRIFESNFQSWYKATGLSKEDQSSKVNRMSIQRDGANCVPIALGYVDSLMRHISKKKKKLEESEKSDVAPKPGEKKRLSEHVGQHLDRFLDTKIKYENLIPPKYIKYMQYPVSISAIITHAKKMAPTDDDYKQWQKVAAELEKMQKEYSLLNKPVLNFLRELGKLEQAGIAKTFISNLVHAGAVKETVTVGELRNLLETKELSKDKFEAIRDKTAFNDEYVYHAHVSDTPLITFIKPEEQSWIRSELTTKAVYKGMSEKPEDMSVQQLLNLEQKIEPLLKSLAKMNDRAQMKRRTETLKVATLVDILERNGIDIDEEMSAVKKFIEDGEAK